MENSNLDTEAHNPSQKRSYHKIKGAQYTLPNDAPEHARLEIQAAHLSAMMSDHIIHAPVSVPRKILDVGCGTGIVTTTLATQYPSAKLLGLDLTPVPKIPGRTVPTNVEFVQGDILNLGLGDSAKDAVAHTEYSGMDTIREGNFDLIYSRLLLCGMSDWPRYLRAAASLLTPGTGWIEIHDLDWIWYDESNNIISDTWEWVTVLREAAEERGLDFSCGSRAAGWMKDAGLVDVKTLEYYWPFGGEWEDEEEMGGFGNYVATEMPRMFTHVIEKVTERKGYSKAQIEQWREQMREDFRPQKGKHWKFYVTYGRRAGRR